MTREEAINTLNASDYLWCRPNEKEQIALNMAIDALTSQNLTEPNNTCEVDLISRADAMAEFRECVKRANENGETPTWNDAVSLIGSLPSADAIHSGGVFVPNMEMPKACDYCLFHDSEWSWCKAKDKYCGDGKCPLIAVRGERREP